MPKKDITDQKFCRLTALRVDEARSTSQTAYWICRCDCGTEKSIRLASLTTRPNLSCGCLHLEIQRKRFTKHGMARTPEYVAWQAMRQRCENPDNPEFKNYGARGIKVCSAWESFPSFFADMGLRPGTGYSIERENNDKGYSPDNCKWATMAEQSDNKQQSRKIIYDGRTQSLTTWAREKGIKPPTLYSRLCDGWTVHDALTTPVHIRSTPATSARVR